MFETLVIHYGYAMILAGTFFEGETVLVIGGYLAHAGYLQLPWVMAAAFVGSFAGDQLFFFIGRKRGTAFLDKRPRWRRKSRRLLRMLQRHQTAVIVGFRFLYGFRTITPFLLGAAGVSPPKFLLLNLLGASLWATAVASLGFLLGKTVSLVMAETHRYELVGVAVIASAGAVAWGWRRYRDAKQADGAAD